MIDPTSTRTPSTPPPAAPGGKPHDLIHHVCRVLGALAWIAIVVWILAPKGSRWASAAFDAGLAWILLTGGGYFAEQTVRSFVDLWKPFQAPLDQNMTCKNKEQTPG